MHGRLPQLPKDGEFVINTGDFLPNASLGDPKIELKFQANWIKVHSDRIRKWLNGRDMLFVQGNHDFVNVPDLLNYYKISCIDLTNKLVEYKNLTFYGFPYIPFINGYWNYEYSYRELRIEVKKMKDSWTKVPDIMCAHTPIRGHADQEPNRPNYGSIELLDFFSYECEKLPKYYLHGHIHQAIVKQLDFNGMKIVNSSLSVNLLEI
jgi:Icc-related predicted phosphoesterase